MMDSGILTKQAVSALSFAATAVICDNPEGVIYPTTPANPLSYPAYDR